MDIPYFEEVIRHDDYDSEHPRWTYPLQKHSVSPLFSNRGIYFANLSGRNYGPEIMTADILQRVANSGGLILQAIEYTGNPRVESMRLKYLKYFG